MHVFGLAVVEKARLYFIDHCWEQFPEICEELGEDEVARLVRAGMAKAAENGYDTRADTLSIVEMTVVYGESFEETEAWARPIWEASLPPARKLAALVNAATEERIRAIIDDENA